MNGFAFEVKKIKTHNCYTIQDKNKIMVSIIIPVYNSEKYIRECLDSLLKQTYINFEIICIDDGSQDLSFEILKEYENRDNRIIVLSQKNQFAGIARNTGMKIARGKYLLFLDSDDFFCNDMLENLIRKAEIDNTDILIFDAYKYDNLSNKIISDTWHALRAPLFGTGIKASSELVDVIYSFTIPVAWNKLFLRDFITQNHFIFQGIKRSNDLFFTYSTLSVAKRIGIIDKKLLYYRVHNNNSLQGNIDDTPEDFMKALYAVKNFLKNRNILQQYNKSFYNMAAAVCVNNLTNLKSENEYKQLCATVVNNFVFDLNKEQNILDTQFLKEIESRKNIVIYGAGAVAEAFVRYLLVFCQYSREKIRIVVSDIANNVSEVYKIDVHIFNEKLLDEQNVRIVIAAIGDRVQSEIKKVLIERKYEKITTVGFIEIIMLIKRSILNNSENLERNDKYNCTNI